MGENVSWPINYYSIDGKFDLKRLIHIWMYCAKNGTNHQVIERIKIYFSNAVQAPSLTIAKVSMAMPVRPESL